MKFTVVRGIDISASQTQDEHAFPWDDLKPGDGFDIPKSYWIEERGVKAEDFKLTRVKERVRNNFKGWRSKDPARADLILVLLILPEQALRVAIKSGTPAEEAAAEKDEGPSDDGPTFRVDGHSAEAA